MSFIYDQVERIARAQGGSYIAPNAILEGSTRDHMRRLAVDLGASVMEADNMRDHELIAIYSVARKNGEAAQDIVRKITRQGAKMPAVLKAPGVEPVEPVGGVTMEALDAKLEHYHERLLDKVLDELPAAAKAAVGDETRASLTAAMFDMKSELAAYTATLPDTIKAHIEALAPRKVEVVNPVAGSSVILDHTHAAFDETLAYCSTRIWPYLVGPAGSGKTTIAEQIAQALKLSFYFAAKVQSEFTLLGFINAAGDIVRTPFREAYEHGGVFLFDEVDGSNANALNAFNAALANSHCPFPDRSVDRHPDFIAIAAGNTFGRGADRQYVGRTQLDAATLDRFAVIEIEYDEELESRIATNAQWCAYIQAVRAEIMARNVRHICSPRATFNGSKMLAVGIEPNRVAEALVWKGLDSEQRAQIEESYNVRDKWQSLTNTLEII